jgi:hypothetical protein
VIAERKDNAVLQPENRADRYGDEWADGIAGRNPDGSVDYGYYRRRASRLRHAKLRESFRRAARYGAPLIVLAMAALAVFAISAGGRHLPPEHAGMVSSWMDDISQRIVSSSSRPFKANDQRKI